MNAAEQNEQRELNAIAQLESNINGLEAIDYLELKSIEWRDLNYTQMHELLELHTSELNELYELHKEELNAVQPHDLCALQATQQTDISALVQLQGKADARQPCTTQKLPFR